MFEYSALDIVDGSDHNQGLTDPPPGKVEVAVYKGVSLGEGVIEG